MLPQRLQNTNKTGSGPEGINTPGTLWTWGRNNEGQLNTNDILNRSSPVQIGVPAVWSNIGAGFYHSLAIKTDGTLWAWGSNSSGRLGDSTVVFRSSPIQIGSSSNWASVSGGSTWTHAIKTDGTLWAWGGNANGELGINTSTDRSSPVQVGTLTNWVQISTGYHSIAVKTDGTLWTWGSGANGRLGSNAVASRSSPGQVGTLTDWAQVSASPQGDTSLALKTDGTLWAWGRNQYGQLGQNNVTLRSSPVQIGALTDWASVCLGKSHSLAVKTDGTLWSWGYNFRGTFGSNTVAPRSSPAQVGLLTNWAQVAAGTYHSLALKTDGTLWSWGYDSNGRLGSNTIAPRSSPAQVGSLKDWAQVKAGSQSMAIQLPTPTTYEDLPLSVVYTDRKYVTAASADPWTFSGASIGTAASNRYVIVGLSIDNNDRSITSVTIRGITATLIASEYAPGITGVGGSVGVQMWIYGAAVPFGTTATIVVTGWSTGNENAGAVVWAVYDISSLTPTDTATAVSASDGAAATTTALDVSANGVMVVFGHCIADSITHDITFAGADIEDVDSSGTFHNSGGSASFESAQTGQTLSCDPSGTTRVGIQAAAFA